MESFGALKTFAAATELYRISILSIIASSCIRGAGIFADGTSALQPGASHIDVDAKDATRTNSLAALGFTDTY